MLLRRAALGITAAVAVGCGEVGTDPPVGAEEIGFYCDDGVDNDSDGLLDCQEPTCGDSPRCTCGNGASDIGELCDDGNADDTDGCTSACVPARCGDRYVQAGVEACDDGNDEPADACDDCVAARCGDGYLFEEACDDGNTDDTDGCIACQVAFCGDGFVREDIESCDDGDQIDNNECRNNCAPASCGDGVTGPDEACDDMNLDDTDACTQQCQLATCGDGQVYAAGGEACDDGNDVTTDACIDCAVAVCGDGFVRAGLEACDDGGNGSGDGCSNYCHRELLNPSFEEQPDFTGWALQQFDGSPVAGIFTVGRRGQLIKQSTPVRDAIDGGMASPACLLDSFAFLPITPADGDYEAVALQSGAAAYRATQQVTLLGDFFDFWVGYDSAATFGARQRIRITLRDRPFAGNVVLSLFETGVADGVKQARTKYSQPIASARNQTLWLEIEVVALDNCLTAHFDGFTQS